VYATGPISVANTVVPFGITSGWRDGVVACARLVLGLYDWPAGAVRAESVRSRRQGCELPGTAP
jgi:hypothetical protein